MHAKRYLWILTGMVCILSANTANAGDLNGVWTKTTHPDPHNITLLIVDALNVKAIGYGMVSGKPAIWFAEGRISGKNLTCTYRYSPAATPPGWEKEGTLQLTISEDARSMQGKAASLSGNWSGWVVFRRLQP